ncbi:DUF6520 family protein [Sediminicola luteus]|uniref:Kazal-like domain-containing protein n=1 Tax=Sediminicola luteus TaxID=319238 RepID=A0A2A4G3L1_9FLAO|nr:DUF6520 family protein [Sediminicola luteus]PCE63021.1 hypothetical protein B7P33_17255 [Sediminicola luteus]
MKKIVLKTALPALALMMAVGLSFATNVEQAHNPNAKQGYINTPQPCTLSRTCSTIPGQLCTDNNGNQVFDKISPTVCTQPLYMPQ